MKGGEVRKKDPPTYTTGAPDLPLNSHAARTPPTRSQPTRKNPPRTKTTTTIRLPLTPPKPKRLQTLQTLKLPGTKRVSAFQCSLEAINRKYRKGKHGHYQNSSHLNNRLHQQDIHNLIDSLPPPLVTQLTFPTEIAKTRHMEGILLLDQPLTMDTSDISEYMDSGGTMANFSSYLQNVTEANNPTTKHLSANLPAPNPCSPPYILHFSLTPNTRWENSTTTFSGIWHSTVEAKSTTRKLLA